MSLPVPQPKSLMLFTMPYNSKVKNARCEFCPYCQLPFRLLRIKTLSLHLEACFRKGKPKKACPKGEQCDSEMIYHYERYSHKLLAKKRSKKLEVVFLDVANSCESENESISSDDDFQDESLAANPSFSKTGSMLQKKVKLNNTKFGEASKVSSETNASYVAPEDTKPIIQESVCPFVKVEPTNQKPNSAKDSQMTSDSETWPVLEPKGPGLFPTIKCECFEQAKQNETAVVKTSFLDNDDDFFLPEVISTAADFQGNAQELKLSSTLPDEDMLFCNLTSTQVPKAKVDDSKLHTSSYDETLPLLSADEHDDCDDLLPDILPSKRKCSLKSPLKTKESLPLKIKLIPFVNPEQSLNKAAKNRQGDIGAMFFGIEPVQQQNHIPLPETTSETRQSQRRCPFYKRINRTDIAVDAFSYGPVPGVNFYLLSHFHYDHYMGLNKHWSSDIYCSNVTGNLVQMKLKLPDERIKRLPMSKPTKIGSTKVTLLEANHCPGAVMFLFNLRDGQIVLHTGDFRADEDLQHNIMLQGVCVNTLHLDTTYLDSSYDFPPQSKVVQFTQNMALTQLTAEPKTLFVTGTYFIGKERIFIGFMKVPCIKGMLLNSTCFARLIVNQRRQTKTNVRATSDCNGGRVACLNSRWIANILKCKVFVSKEKSRTLQCMGDDVIMSQLTTDVHQSCLHVVPMGQLNTEKLRAYLEKFNGKYKQLVAIKATGWTHSNKKSDLNGLKPSVSGPISIYAVPYSEHSSFNELKNFVELLKPQKIIPTVNVAKAESRQKMERFLNEWKK